MLSVVLLLFKASVFGMAYAAQPDITCVAQAIRGELEEAERLGFARLGGLKPSDPSHVESIRALFDRMDRVLGYESGSRSRVGLYLEPESAGKMRGGDLTNVGFSYSAGSLAVEAPKAGAATRVRSEEVNLFTTGAGYGQLQASQRLKWGEATLYEAYKKLEGQAERVIQSKNVLPDDEKVFAEIHVMDSWQYLRLDEVYGEAVAVISREQVPTRNDLYRDVIEMPLLNGSRPPDRFNGQRNFFTYELLLSLEGPRSMQTPAVLKRFLDHPSYGKKLREWGAPVTQREFLLQPFREALLSNLAADGALAAGVGPKDVERHLTKILQETIDEARSNPDAFFDQTAAELNLKLIRRIQPILQKME